MKHTIRIATVALALVGVLGACSSDPTAPEPQVITEVEFHPLLEVDLSAMTKTASGLYYEDLEVGQGTVVEAGDSADVRYAGYLADGRNFDSGIFTFLVGVGDVIDGFDEGVQGIAVGGARKLVIPPELGYGSNGARAIPPGAILVFNVRVERVVEGPF